MSETKPVKEVTIEFYESDIDKVIGYYCFFEKQLELGNKIPARVIKKFLTFIKSDSIKEIERKSFVNSLSEKVYSRFNTKEYSFLKDKKALLGSVEMLFEEIIKRQTSRELVTKDECVQFAYDYLIRIRDFSIRKRINTITNYKITVISAYVAIIAGYKLAEKSSTNYELFHSARHAVSKIAKK